MIENFLILKKQPFSYTFSTSIGEDISQWSCNVVLYYNNEARYSFSNIILTSDGYITLGMIESDVNDLLYHNYIYKVVLDNGAGRKYVPFWGHAFVERID